MKSQVWVQVHMQTETMTHVRHLLGDNAIPVTQGHTDCSDSAPRCLLTPPARFKRSLKHKLRTLIHTLLALNPDAYNVKLQTKMGISSELR